MHKVWYYQNLLGIAHIPENNDFTPTELFRHHVDNQPLYRSPQNMYNNASNIPTRLSVKSSRSAYNPNAQRYHDTRRV